MKFLDGRITNSLFHFSITVLLSNTSLIYSNFYIIALKQMHKFKHFNLILSYLSLSCEDKMIFILFEKTIFTHYRYSIIACLFSFIELYKSNGRLLAISCRNSFKHVSRGLNADRNTSIFTLDGINHTTPNTIRK